MNHKGHSGPCRVVRHFWSPWAKELAAKIEVDFRTAFGEHDAVIKVQPIRISHLSEVGEGVQLSLVPDDPKRWDWWGEFESDLEVRRRRRLARAWHDLLRPEEVEGWLRKEADGYLSRLRERPAH